jgi:tetratricopeptide (TPR) repeat protein
MRKSLAIIMTSACVVAIPAGCSQPKGLSTDTRISPQTHVASGRMLEAQQNFQGAAAQYQQAIDTQPDLTVAYHRLAELYIKLGQFDEAQRTLRKAIEAGADEASLRNNLGFTLLRLERYDEAEQMFNSALAISPDFHRARMNLALLHARAGRIEESVEQFERMLPRADALYNVAVIRMQQRDYLTAAWGFGEAAELNPNLPDARIQFDKAMFLARHAPQPKASEDFLAALNVAPQSREPAIVQTTAAQITPPAPRAIRRAPAPRPERETFAARPAPARQSVRKTAAIAPKPIEQAPTPTTPEPVVSQPVAGLMRDISSTVRSAAVAIAPIVVREENVAASDSTSNDTPSPDTSDCEFELTDSSSVISEAPAWPTTVEPQVTKKTSAKPINAVQLTSAQPTARPKAQPMIPVTTE